MVSVATYIACTPYLHMGLRACILTQACICTLRKGRVLALKQPLLQETDSH